LSNTSASGFGLYVHWPFCESKCPYCDFNSHVSAKIDQSKWLDAYLSEIRRVGSETKDRVLDTVFFGGGTPSLMDPETVSMILSAVAQTWRCSNDVEITLEANPGSVEAGKFREFHAAGVNRLSIGVQSLNDTDLRVLGRMHSAADARRAIDIAQSTFDRVSFDLIYARQNQTLKSWEAELDSALVIGTSHLSLYQLTIEDGTVFEQRYKKGLLPGLPNEDIGADMYELTQDICAAHEMPAYEVSNHSKLGEESRHNLIYWRGGDYAGIGPGAHGRLTLNGYRVATECHRHPNKWLDDVQRTGTGESLRDTLTTDEVLTEYILMGLRISDGIKRDRLAELGMDITASTDIRDLAEAGLIYVDDHTVRASAAGRLVLNSVIQSLLNKT